MSGRIRVAFALALIAGLIAVIAASAQEPEPAEPADGETAGVFFNAGWCVQPNPNTPAPGTTPTPILFNRLTTENSSVDLFSSRESKNNTCGSKYTDGFWLNDGEKDRIEGATGGIGIPGFTVASQYPNADWFDNPLECVALAGTGNGTNRLETVYTAKIAELVVQIAYDIGSNEISGITGAIIGAVLAVPKFIVFSLEWTYDVQDECQEILERRTIAEIKTNLALCKPLPTFAPATVAPKATPVGATATPSGCTEDKTLGIHDQKVQLDIAALATDVATHDADIKTRLSLCKPLPSGRPVATPPLTPSCTANNTLGLHDWKVQTLATAIQQTADKILLAIGGVQVTLDTVIELRRVHLQVIKLPGSREFLVLADEAGVPIDVTFTNIQFSSDDPVSFVDVTGDTEVTSDKTGVFLLVVDPQLINDTKHAKVWEFRVEHAHGNDPSHFGVVLFSENAWRNVGGAQ
ncbi:MAG: hypothetical protein J4N95_04915 [Chloroflexi bacterium]|nr:hypothetical protein [Chloroflexota bacterium]